MLARIMLIANMKALQIKAVFTQAKMAEDNNDLLLRTTAAILDANVAYVKLEYMGNTNEK